MKYLQLFANKYLDNITTDGSVLHPNITGNGNCFFDAILYANGNRPNNFDGKEDIEAHKVKLNKLRIHFSDRQLFVLHFLQ